MPMTSRSALALGLTTLLAAGVVVSQTRGQAAKDAAVRRTNNPATSAAAKPATPSVVGTINMDRVFQEYKKVKDANDQINADALVKSGELQKIGGEYTALMKELEGLSPGSDDFKTREARLGELKIRIEAGREQAQAEFARREAEALADIYKEVTVMTERCAQYKNINYVLRVSDIPPTNSEPRAVMAAMSRAVVYADSSNDITDMVIANLNKSYEATHPASAAPAATPPAAAAPTTGAVPKGR